MTIIADNLLKLGQLLCDQVILITSGHKRLCQSSSHSVIHLRLSVIKALISASHSHRCPISLLILGHQLVRQEREIIHGLVINIVTVRVQVVTRPPESWLLMLTFLLVEVVCVQRFIMNVTTGLAAVLLIVFKVS